MEKIGEIKEAFLQGREEQWRVLIRRYEGDERPGVRKLCEKYEKEMEKLKKERQRIEGMRIFEKQYEDKEYICGIDEVGRGPLAGPVVAGAVILPKDCVIYYVNDSKKLTEKKTGRAV